MAANDNPYLALLQQEDKPPSLAQILQHVANLGFGMAGGLGQAASQGGSTIGGLGSGLILGNQINAQAAQRAEQERMKRLEWQFKAQEHEDKRAKELREQAALDAYGKQPPLGFHVAPQQGPIMGPGGTPPQGPQPAAAPGPDLKTGGAPLVAYLVAQHGLSPLAASTVVGNLYQESGFNPSATGDSGSAFGMAQWRLDRQTGLRNFAATQNKPVTDPQVQIDYLVSEMKGGDMGAQRAFAGLQQAKTPEQANTAMMHFFRPQGYTPANPAGGHGFQNRVQNTQALLPQERPVDPATAPVPTVNPYAVAAPPPGPAPRPGLGPRATPTPPTEPPPVDVPVAQGGGEGEVVLPRIGLPFPAPARAPAPPGSVPFPAAPAAPAAPPGQTAPGGPVQPNYTPTQPGMVPQTPAGGPAPGGADAPPVRVRRPPVTLPPELNDRINAGVVAKVYTPQQADTLKHQLVTEEQRRRDAEDDAQHAAQLKAWEVQRTTAGEQRRQQAQIDAEERAQKRQLEAEQRRTAAEQERHDRDIAERQKARDDAAKQSGDKLSLEQTKAQRDSEDKARDDFNAIKQVQDFRKADLVFQSAQKAAKTDTKAADLNLVYAFATMMDPGSVVRDQETGMVVATQGASDRVKALVASVSGKSGLSLDAKAALIKEMGTRHSAYMEAHDAFATAFEDLARRRGLDPANVVTRVVVEKQKEEKKDDSVIDVVPGTSGKRK